jgi:PEGA domain-containing protein
MRRAGIVRGVLAGLFLSCALPLFAQTSPAGQGAVSVRARPANADVFIDGERWVTPGDEGALTVQLLPGQHRIEVRAPGYHTFSTVVTVRPGETLPVNVSLSAGTDVQEPTPPRAPTTPAAGPSPLVQVPSAQDGFAFAPDFRITELNHQTTQFLGAYGGVVFAGQVLFGAGGYWQADSPSDMWYFGPVAEWRLWHDRAVGITAHGLAGYGEAFIRTFPVDGRPDFRFRRFGFYDGFFVGEPEVQVIARLTSYLRLHVGAGYRFTSSHNDLDGASGSISLQFGR